MSQTLQRRRHAAADSRRAGRAQSRPRPAARPPRGRGAGRRDRHLHLLLHHRAPVPQRQLAVHRPVRQLDLRPDGDAGRAADDRRRVRPVRGRRGHQRGAGRIHVQLRVHRERVGRRGRSRWSIALLIGFINGWIVVKTGIPSFLVTLGTFFMLRGTEPGPHPDHHQPGRRARTSPTSQGFNSAQKVFAPSFTIGGVSVRSRVLYWIVFVIIATWILLRTHIGNWIFSVGGTRRPAPGGRRAGRPDEDRPVHGGGVHGLVHRHAHPVRCSTPIQSGQGVGNEFVYIIAAVVGGCLLTGGYGSAVGAAIGAFIFGMANQGIVYAGWNPDWFYVLPRARCCSARSC